MIELNYDCLLKVFAFLDRPALSKCLKVTRLFRKAALKTLKDKKLVRVNVNMLEDQDVLYERLPRVGKEVREIKYPDDNKYERELEQDTYLPEFVTIEEMTVGGRWILRELAPYGRQQMTLSDLRLANAVAILKLDCSKDIRILDLKFDENIMLSRFWSL
ncbi:hypothetical protein L596_030932 [Steinernema carpocapsae]|uniref:F-box domain-containing protein n=1 Tax=Steinernema carpocapsae TaxID=34508 RepID=A0A4U5MHA9_STECR|nr:hypothetical protein L596_030932 [Steinernema carpocapsae]